MRFFIRRTARAILTLWVAMTLTFALVRFLPGGPITQIKNQLQQNNPRMSDAQIQSRLEDRVADLGLLLDAPLHEQYIHYMTNLLQGDLGMSILEGEPVNQVMAQSVPWTVFVVVVSVLIIFAIAVTWGAIIAYYEGGPLDTVSSGVSIMTAAMPFYVLAFALLLLFSYRFGWFPTGGKLERFQDVEPTWAFFSSAIHHAALPIVSLVLSQVGVQMLAMRGNSIQVLGQDYVRVARLRGLADRRIATRYVARNAILPLYTSFLTLIGFLLGGTIILEDVFRYRGMGWYMFRGLENRDYALVMATFLVYAVALVLAVYVADLTYSFIDPRVKQGDASEAY